jgi:hypothetical protein
VTPVGRSWNVRVAAQLAVLVVGLMGALSYSVWLGLAATAVFALHGCLDTPSPPAGGARPARVPEQRAAPVAPPASPAFTSVNHLAILSDSELCREWRQSFVVLRGARGCGRRAWVVSMRQALLEELERRNPEALESWLRSGGGAAGGPERYFR